jgi:2-keto-4-pentenoate hydratase
MPCKTPWCGARPDRGVEGGRGNPQALPARAALTQAIRCGSAPAGQVQDLPVAGNAVIGVEAELAYELACDLPPREQPYSAAEVLAAVRSAHAAIEVCDTRYAAWGVQGEWSRLADQACHGALVVGSGTCRCGGCSPCRCPSACG